MVSILSFAKNGLPTPFLQSSLLAVYLAGLEHGLILLRLGHYIISQLARI
jgi:hypothetical protein